MFYNSLWIKRENERILQNAKSFGKNSTMYQKTLAELKSAGVQLKTVERKVKASKSNPKGGTITVYQIVNSKQNVSILNEKAPSGSKTVREHKTNAKKRYEEEFGKKKKFTTKDVEKLDKYYRMLDEMKREIYEIFEKGVISDFTLNMSLDERIEFLNNFWDKAKDGLYDNYARDYTLLRGL